MVTSPPAHWITGGVCRLTGRSPAGAATMNGRAGEAELAYNMRAFWHVANPPRDARVPERTRV